MPSGMMWVSGLARTLLDTSRRVRSAQEGEWIVKFIVVIHEPRCWKNGKQQNELDRQASPISFVNKVQRLESAAQAGHGEQDDSGNAIKGGGEPTVIARHHAENEKNRTFPQC